MDRTELVDRAKQVFTRRFGYGPHAVGVAPGRVELLGNHTDYNEGFVLTAAIDRDVAIAGAAREVPLCRVLSDSHGEVEFAPGTLVKDADAPWADYVKGVVEQLGQAGDDIGGFDAAIVSSVPSGAGVSSSAALLVATAQLLLALYPHSLGLEPMAIARLCRAAENDFVGAPVGLLDQFSSVFGQAGHALFLDCRTLDWRAVALPADRAGILIVDTGVKHALAAGGGYSERHAQCNEAARLLARRETASLRDISPQTLEENVHRLDPVLEKRARHVVYENVRVEMGAQALEMGNIDAFGEMLTNTHESCRRFFENSCPEVDFLVENALGHPGVFGAKLTGGGWGGCAVVLHRPEVTETLSAALVDGFRKRFGREAALLPTIAASGAEAIALL